jgi:hypothetical protein
MDKSGNIFVRKISYARLLGYIFFGPLKYPFTIRNETK